jgi:hypothetical protein
MRYALAVLPNLEATQSGGGGLCVCLYSRPPKQHQHCHSHYHSILHYHRLLLHPNIACNLPQHRNNLGTISIIFSRHINKQLHLSTPPSCFVDNPPRSLLSRTTLLLMMPINSARIRRRINSSVETSILLATRSSILPKAQERIQEPRNKDSVFPETSHWISSPRLVVKCTNLSSDARNLSGWACFFATSLREETLAAGISIPLRVVVNTPLTLPSATCPTSFCSSALERHSILLIDRDHGAIATTPSVGLCHSLAVLLLFYFCKSIAIVISMYPYSRMLRFALNLIRKVRCIPQTM